MYSLNVYEDEDMVVHSSWSTILLFQHLFLFVNVKSFYILCIWQVIILFLCSFRSFWQFFNKCSVNVLC